MDKQSKIFVAGHRGMVGSAIVRKLAREGYRNVVVRTHVELDLADQMVVSDFLAFEKLDFVFLAAAKVGGINVKNTLRAEFLYQNLMTEANIIHSAWKAGVQRIEPHRVCRRPFRLSYAATAASSSMA